jgi:hypothetical protein
LFKCVGGLFLPQLRVFCHWLWVRKNLYCCFSKGSSEISCKLGSIIPFFWQIFLFGNGYFRESYCSVCKCKKSGFLVVPSNFIPHVLVDLAMLKVVDSEMLSAFRPCVDVVSCPGDSVSSDLLSFMGPENERVLGVIIGGTKFNGEGFKGCLSLGCQW